MEKHPRKGGGNDIALILKYIKIYIAKVKRLKILKCYVRAILERKKKKKTVLTTGTLFETSVVFYLIDIKPACFPHQHLAT